MTTQSGDSTTGRRSIAAIANTYGLSFRTLRFYEEQGLLQPMRIGYERFYSQTDETRLQLIIKGKRLGFTLHEIGRMIGYVGRNHEDTVKPLDLGEMMDLETLKQQTEHLEQRRADIDQAIAELKAARDMSDLSPRKAGCGA